MEYLLEYVQKQKRTKGLKRDRKFFSSYTSHYGNTQDFFNLYSCENCKEIEWTPLCT